jgi:hypothetical protein
VPATISVQVQRGGGKWSVTRQEYPKDTYPAYCAGLAYLLTPDAAKDFYSAANRVPFFWIDDVYATGILPLAPGVGSVSRISLNLRFTMDRRQLVHWLKKAPPGVPPPYFVTHLNFANDEDWDRFVYAAWKKLSKIGH